MYTITSSTEENILDIIGRVDIHGNLQLVKGATGLYIIQDKKSGQLFACEPHFNDASIIAICNYLMQESYKIAILQPHLNKHSLQVTLSKEIFSCSTTTYYLILPNVTTGAVLVSLSVSLVQLAILVQLAAGSELAFNFDTNGYHVIPHIFMAAYLSFYLTRSLSDIAISAVGADNTGKLTFSNLIAFFIRVASSLVLIFLRIFTEIFRPRSLGFLSSVCIIAEFTVILLLVGTTIVVVSQQTTPVSMIANFVGLLLILDLDDLVAASIDFKSYRHVLAYEDEDLHENTRLTDEEKEARMLEKELARPFGKFVISIWFFIVLFVCITLA